MRKLIDPPINLMYQLGFSDPSKIVSSALYFYLWTYIDPKYLLTHQTYTDPDIFLGNILTASSLTILQITLILSLAWLVGSNSAMISKLFGSYSATISKLFSSYLAAIKQAFRSYSATIWQHFSNYIKASKSYLAAIWQLFSNYLEAVEQRFDSYSETSQKLFSSYLAAIGHLFKSY